MSNHFSVERLVDLWRVIGCFMGFMGMSYSTLRIRRYTTFDVKPFDTNGYFRPLVRMVCSTVPKIENNTTVVFSSSSSDESRGPMIFIIILC